MFNKRLITELNFVMNGVPNNVLATLTETNEYNCSNDRRNCEPS